MKTQKRKIAGLKEHPRQHEFFSDATDAELDELAADMDQRGQQDPVRILPDDRIVEGHQRLRAARKLGWEEIDVIVCHELAEAGEDAILYALISDNVNRRQVDDLTRARCYEELRVIEKKEILEGRRKVRSGDSRDRLAERLGAGISGRQLDRLRQLLLLPRPIQDAISRREMPQSLGHKILKIEPEKQDEIAQRLVLKDTVDQIITQFDLKSERRQPSRGPAEIGLELFVLIDKHLDVLLSHVDQLNDSLLSIPALEGAAELFSELLEQRRTRRELSTRELLEQFPNVCMKNELE